MDLKRSLRPWHDSYAGFPVTSPFLLQRILINRQNMYRFRKADKKEYTKIDAFTEVIDAFEIGSVTDIYDLQNCPICNVVSEGRDIYGFIAAADSATEGDQGDTLFIRSLRLPELPADQYAEIFEFLIRATIIQGRMSGYERVVIDPRESDRSKFTEWGFTFLGDEDAGEMECILTSCRGYCPFCRAC